jgi:hypothetical protein
VAVDASRNVAAEIPSIADELRTFRSTPCFRAVGVLMWALLSASGFMG